MVIGSFDLAPGSQRRYIIPRSMIGKGIMPDEMRDRLVAIGREAREENDRLLGLWRAEWEHAGERG